MIFAISKKFLSFLADENDIHDMIPDIAVHDAEALD